jgi:PAS domain S-box-containing protein
MNNNQNVAATYPPGGAADYRLELALRQAQVNLLRYQDLFDFAPDAYLVTDVQAVIQEANHAAAALLNTRKEFLVGKPLVFYVAEGDRRGFTGNLLRLAQAGESRVQWELTLRPSRAAPVYALVTVAPVLAAEQPAGFRWTFKDITCRSQLEETLRAEKEFSDSLVEMATAAILVLDGAGRIRRANSYLCELTGSRRDELTGRAFADLLVAQDRSSAREALAGVATDQATAHGVHHLRTPDAAARTIAWSARALPAGPGERSQVLFVGNDVTDLHGAQQRALHAERLAAIGQLAAGLAHESRNCLQRSQACLTMLGYRLADQPEALQLLRRAQRAQDDLHRLYEEVREYAAPLRLDLHPCRLSEVWRQGWENLLPGQTSSEPAAPARAPAATLVEETATVDLEVTASPFHLIQVFRNLFDNALGAGTSRVTVRCTPVELDHREAVQVAVADNGTGFAKEERQRAFEDFFTTKVRGTGLGLAICKRIIEAHGGRISVGEAAPPGAVILITLPRRPT